MSPRPLPTGSRCTGAIEWCQETGTEREASEDIEFVASAPAVAGDTLLLGVRSATGAAHAGDLLGLDTASGAKRWRTTLPVDPERIAVADGRVFVSGRGGGVSALAVEGRAGSR